MKSILMESGLETLRLLRLSEATLPTMMMPIMFYWLMFGLFDASGYQAVVGLVIIASMAPGAFSGAIYVANERQQGWLNLRWQFGKLGWWVSKQMSLAAISVIASLPVIFLASLTGQVELTTLQLAQLLLVCLCTSALFTTLGIVAGLLLSESGAIAMINLVFFPLLLVSGLTVPLSALPNWLSALAEWLPPQQLIMIANGDLHVGLVASMLAGIVLTLGSMRLCRY